MPVRYTKVAKTHTKPPNSKPIPPKSMNVFEKNLATLKSSRPSCCEGACQIAYDKAFIALTNKTSTSTALFKEYLIKYAGLVCQTGKYC